MKLYELVGRDPKSGFSPFVWRIKMALAHKGLDYELVPLYFTEIKEELAFANSKTVPVLVDGENIISDSFNIASYLEETYPDRPSLFGGVGGKTAAKLLGFQIARPLLMPLFRTLVADIYGSIDPKDKEYFRQSREPRIGCTIEEAAESYDEALKTFQNNLIPYDLFLQASEFYSGETPAYADYVMYGIFLWARRTSKKVLIEQDSKIASWIKRMDGLFDGLGSQVKMIEKP
ncbi:MAG: glutathione S-transferase family protein [Emcibacteraceae bacterium]|nr:glutathione S-transferase family protein [Emcibacteraceae bacterium]MDG1858879.1 glutathione S-transferase family protein [Emcibacteraceae bacterium]